MTWKSSKRTELAPMGRTFCSWLQAGPERSSAWPCSLSQPSLTLRGLENHFLWKEAEWACEFSKGKRESNVNEPLHGKERPDLSFQPDALKRAQPEGRTRPWRWDRRRGGGIGWGQHTTNNIIKNNNKMRGHKKKKEEERGRKREGLSSAASCGGFSDRERKKRR